MAQLTAEEKARREAARQALLAPTIPAAEQAIADAPSHNRMQAVAEAMAAETAQTATLELPRGYVRARVLRKGHDKIYTGQIDGTNPDAEGKFTRFKFGEIIALPGDVALAQENNGNIEVQPAYRRMLGLPEEG